MTERNYLTCDQAKRLTGFSATRIARACNDGDLPHEVVTLGPTGKRIYQIDSSDLVAWANGPQAPRPSRRWTAADEAALRELYLSGSCSIAQIAAYLGRRPKSITAKASELGITINGPERYRRRRIPGTIPAGAVVIAKTCTRCGNMRDADQYPPVKHGGGGLSAWCRFCHAERRRGQFRREPAYLAQRKVQAVTKARARNEGRPYGEPEVRVLRDLTRTDLDVALELGRSLYAVHQKRVSIGAVVEVRGPRVKRSRRALWRIDLALEERAVLEHFRRLGGAVPEDLFEWAEEAIA